MSVTLLLWVWSRLTSQLKACDSHRMLSWCCRDSPSTAHLSSPPWWYTETLWAWQTGRCQNWWCHRWDHASLPYTRCRWCGIGARALRSHMELVPLLLSYLKRKTTLFLTLSQTKAPIEDLIRPSPCLQCIVITALQISFFTFSHFDCCYWRNHQARLWNSYFTFRLNCWIIIWPTAPYTFETSKKGWPQGQIVFSPWSVTWLTFTPARRKLLFSRKAFSLVTPLMNMQRSTMYEGQKGGKHKHYF